MMLILITKKNFLSNQIKRKEEISSSNLREVFKETCRESHGASCVTFKKLEVARIREGEFFNRNYFKHVRI